MRDLYLVGIGGVGYFGAVHIVYTYGASGSREVKHICHRVRVEGERLGGSLVESRRRGSEYRLYLYRLRDGEDEVVHDGLVVDSKALHLEAVVGYGSYHKLCTILYRATRSHDFAAACNLDFTAIHIAVVGNGIALFPEEYFDIGIVGYREAKPRDTSSVYKDTIEFIVFGSSCFDGKYRTMIYTAARGDLLRTVQDTERAARQLMVSNGIVVRIYYRIKSFPYRCCLIDIFLAGRYYQFYSIQCKPMEYTCVYRKRCLPTDSNGCKIATIGKSPSFNTRYTTWDSNSGKTTTIEKSTHTNTRYTIWNIDRGKAITTGKSLSSDTRYTVWDINRGKAGATEKSLSSNISYTIWNIDRNQPCTPLENSSIIIIKIIISYRVYSCGNSDRIKACTIIKGTISNFSYTIRDSNRGKTPTVSKSILSDTRYAVWYIDRGKAITTGKSTLSNTRYTIGNSDRGKSATAGKSILSDTRYTIWNIDRGKSSTVGKSPPFDTRYTVWDSNRGKAATAGKSPSFNTRYTTWNIDRGKTATAVKSILSNTCNTTWNSNRCQSATINVFTTDYYSIFYR